MDESTDVTAVVSEEQPAISHDEYLELVSMRQSLLELKAQKSDVLEFVNVAQQYAAQLQQAQQQLNVINEALSENTAALQERMKEIVEPLGVSGEFTITDTEPHYIVANQFDLINKKQAFSLLFLCLNYWKERLTSYNSHSIR